MNSDEPERTDMWHRPKPGPMYWDWRCLVCSENVAAHPDWFARLRHAVTTQVKVERDEVRREAEHE